MKILFCGGGTVGHIAPAIAIADYIKKTEKDSEILFIGRDNGNENRLIELKKYKKLTLDVSGFKRKISLNVFGIVMHVLRIRN
jgi:UDP-N-acetylglucosamine--N-acetylmuramyl-(pentapeptide) pyrophosphoryl-undecaprenol N-acetylglucosamine transferase